MSARSSSQVPGFAIPQNRVGSGNNMVQIKESTRGCEPFVPYACSADDSLRTFGVEPETGLDSETVAERRVQYGFNELVGAPPTPRFLKFLEQFNSLVVWILIVAALISGAMGEWIETIAILAIVLLNAVLGDLQEAKSERALAAFAQIGGPNCTGHPPAADGHNRCQRARAG